MLINRRLLRKVFSDLKFAANEIVYNASGGMRVSYSRPFYRVVAFVLGLMLLVIPLTAQYSNFAIPAIILGLVYVYYMWVVSLLHKRARVFIRLFIHLIYTTIAVRTMYVACDHIFMMHNIISWIDMLFALVAFGIFGIKTVIIFVNNYDDIISLLH